MRKTWDKTLERFTIHNTYIGPTDKRWRALARQFNAVRAGLPLSVVVHSLAIEDEKLTGYIKEVIFAIDGAEWIELRLRIMPVDFDPLAEPNRVPIISAPYPEGIHYEQSYTIDGDALAAGFFLTDPDDTGLMEQLSRMITDVWLGEHRRNLFFSQVAVAAAMMRSESESGQPFRVKRFIPYLCAVMGTHKTEQAFYKKEFKQFPSWQTIAEEVYNGKL